MEAFLGGVRRRRISQPWEALSVPKAEHRSTGKCAEETGGGRMKGGEEAGSRLQDLSVTVRRLCFMAGTGRRP